ncbi:hypothetical protein [Chromobacterium violaceum]|uniref:hypothetical protein n=1 Tax=Chromobacterium violaceum TaxID=536 RepID=UPI0015F287C6|nr:hypothetical protein [Chromobacterium violaceum]
MTSVLESIARLCRGTPTLEIRDNRGQPVRMLQYNRTPGNGMVLDERVTRQTANALGQTDSQIDPRLFSAGSTRPNFRYDLSLSGQTLSSASVDAGERYQLMDIEGRPCWSLDSRGNQRQFHYDRLGRPSAVIEQESGSAERVGQYWQYGEDTAASSPGCNLRGQIVAHYDTAGVQRTTAYGLQGQPLVTTRQLLRTAEQASDWALSQQSQWRNSYRRRSIRPNGATTHWARCVNSKTHKETCNGSAITWWVNWRAVRCNARAKASRCRCASSTTRRPGKSAGRRRATML